MITDLGHSVHVDGPLLFDAPIHDSRCYTPDLALRPPFPYVVFF